MRWREESAHQAIGVKDRVVQSGSSLGSFPWQGIHKRYKYLSTRFGQNIHHCRRPLEFYLSSSLLLSSSPLAFDSASHRTQRTALRHFLYYYNLRLYITRMASFAQFQKSNFLAIIFSIILTITVLASDQADVTTSCTTITVPSTFATVPTPLKETPSEAPPQESASSEREPPAAEPAAGPHHITMSLPLPTLPSPEQTPAARPPAGQPASGQPQGGQPQAGKPCCQPAAQPPAVQPPQRTTVLPPSTTWRFDPAPQPARRIPKPCNELEKIAWGRYRTTMDLCKKAANGTPKEVENLIKGLRGYDFRWQCKVTPPVGCCFDPTEMMNAKRCFTWFPRPGTPEWYEPLPV